MPAVKAVATTARHALRAQFVRHNAYDRYRQYATRTQSITTESSRNTREIDPNAPAKRVNTVPYNAHASAWQSLKEFGQTTSAGRPTKQQDGPPSNRQQNATPNRPHPKENLLTGNGAPLMHFIYELHPKPINCTTFTSTKTFLTDPSHPLHIKTKRRYADFDPNILHWRIQVPMSVSKKAAIRNNARKRLRHAFWAELKRRGLRQDGTIREKGFEARNYALKGALLINMSNDPKQTLTFNEEQATKTAKFVLDRVEQKLRLEGRPSAIVNRGAQ